MIRAILRDLLELATIILFVAVVVSYLAGVSP
jgi:hypothetical protein